MPEKYDKVTISQLMVIEGSYLSLEEEDFDKCYKEFLKYSWSYGYSRHNSDFPGILDKWTSCNTYVFNIQSLQL